MSEKKEVVNGYEEVEIEIEKEFVDLFNKANKERKLTKEELDKLYKETKESIEFLNLIDKIDLPKEKYVVFTDGEEQLVYENGEFFYVSSTDGTSKKKKIARKEAINAHLEYFIKYQINPIIRIKEELERKRGRNIDKDIQKETTRVKTIKEKPIEQKEKKEEPQIDDRIR